MWVRYLIAVLGITLIFTAWAWVQGAWRRTFAEDTIDEDALAGRISCSGCSCSGGSCKTSQQTTVSGVSNREGRHASV